MKSCFVITVLAICFQEIDADDFNVRDVRLYKRTIEDYYVSKFPEDPDANSDYSRAFGWCPEAEQEGEILRVHNIILSTKRLVDSPTCKSDEIPTLENLRKLRDTRIIGGSSRIDEAIDFIFNQHGFKCRPYLSDKINRFMNRLVSSDAVSLSAMAKEMRKNTCKYYALQGAYAAISSHIEDPLVAPVLQGSTIKSMNVKQFDALYNKYIFQPCKRLVDFELELGEESEVSNVLRAYVNEKEADQSVADYYYASEACDKLIDQKYKTRTGTDPKDLAAAYGRLREDVMSKVRIKAGTKIERSFFSKH